MSDQATGDQAAREQATGEQAGATRVVPDYGKAATGTATRLLEQTWALFVDAYRQVNASALFWISLVLSALAALVIAVPSIGADGVSIFGWTLIPVLTDDELPRGQFYKILFTAIGLTAPLIAWLTIWGNVLALVSTAGIFPGLVSGGAVDVYLSKPIGRARLFLTKYVTGLLFVAAQVLTFCGIGFLVIGLRGGEWEPGVLLGVPLVLLVFSYLWAVSVLVGVWTRSTLMAVLLTVVAWGVMAGVQVAEGSVLAFRVAAEVRAERAQAAVDNADRQLVAAVESGSESRTQLWQLQLDSAEEVRDGAASTAGDLRFWHNLAWGTYAVLPKTSGTSSLMARWLIDTARLDFGEQGRSEQSADANLMQMLDRDPVVRERIREAERSRSPLFIIGTSLLTEAALVLLACWIFARRDY